MILERSRQIKKNLGKRTQLHLCYLTAIPPLQPLDSTQSSFDLHHTYTPSSYPTRFVLCSFAHKMLPALLAARSGFISLALVSVHQCNSFNSQALGNTFAPCVAPAQRLYPLPAHMLTVGFFFSFFPSPKIPSFRKPPSSPPGNSYHHSASRHNGSTNLRATCSRCTKGTCVAPRACCIN